MYYILKRDYSCKENLILNKIKNIEWRGRGKLFWNFDWSLQNVIQSIFFAPKIHNIFWQGQ